MTWTNPAAGFTLIELLITVVILGILAAVAIPTYERYLQTARRADARAALLSTSNQLEKFFSDNLAYTDSLAVLGQSSDSPDGYYSVSISTSGTGYSVEARAKPSGRQENDRACARFALTHTGARSAWSTENKDTSDICW